MNNKKVVQESVWECRRTKIELEHEVLLREMEALLIGIIGLPIAIVTIAFQFQVWQSISLVWTLAYIAIVLFVVMAFLISDRKEKIIAKEKELDALILEISKASNQGSKSR